LTHLLVKELVTPATVQQLRKEIADAEFIRQRVEYYLEKHRDLVFGWSWEQRLHGKQFSRVLFLYILLRLLQPEKVIETGCFSGWTSTLILFALHQNNRGHLWTFDIPAQAGRLSMKMTLPSGLSPGFLVPDCLRSRWTLIIGDVRDYLLPVCHKLGTVDVFYHDSDHTYEHMMWEYTSVWPFLRAGGVLISDDIGANTAFWDFSVATGSPMVISKLNTNLGAMRKS
jgi:predicted O-methyltransferase YrrM